MLPQREICRLFACCRKLLGTVSPAESEQLQDRLALISPEIASWIRVTHTPEYPKGETQRLTDLLHTAQHLGYSILSARKLSDLDIPAEIRAQLEAKLTKGKRGAMPPSQLGNLPAESVIKEPEIEFRFKSPSHHACVPLGRSGPNPLCISPQQIVHASDRQGSVAHCGCDAFGCSGATVAGGENPGT